MSLLRVRYEVDEVTKRGYVNGIDTGTPDFMRTFRQGNPTFYIDDEQVDAATFRAHVAELRALHHVEHRVTPEER